MSKPVVAMFDDFFPDAFDVFDRVTDGPFEDFESPWDGVVYPGINKSLPHDVVNFVFHRLAEILNRPIDISAIFARTMLQGVKAPHRIHSDRIMGEYSMHIYLSKVWEAESGTSFWTHNTQGNKHTDATDCLLIDRDHASFDQWTRNIVMLGKFNRAVLHDASLFHCAEPGSGWGDNPKNGRLVLTTFFSEAK